MQENLPYLLRANLGRDWGLIALRGLLAVIFGVLAIAWPLITVWTLSMLWGVFALADGAFACGTGWRLHKQGVRWWPYLAFGVIGALAGAALGGSRKDKNIFRAVQGGGHVLHGLTLGGGGGCVFKGQGVGKRAFKVDAHNSAVNGHVEPCRAVLVRAMGHGRAGGKQGSAGRQKDRVFHYFSRQILRVLTDVGQNLK